jgi:RNA polymerase sigma-70 factor (ECF subfamily)
VTDRTTATRRQRERAPASLERSQGTDLDRRIAELLAAGGHRQAATEAIRGHGPALLRYLRGLLGDEGEAAEAFASFAERLWKGIGDFRGESTIRTWAFRLAWSAAADLRKEAWRTRVRRLETNEADAVPADQGTRSWLRAERLRLSLAELRATLTLEEQSLLQLRIDQGLSWAECAEVLAAEGGEVRAEALMKRFERIKAKLGRLVRGRRNA